MSNEITRRRFLTLAAITAASGKAFSFPADWSGPDPLPLEVGLLLTAGLPIREPYASLHGGQFTGPSIPESPDPLVRYRWREVEAGDDMQVYALSPVKVFTDTPAFFRNAGAFPHQTEQITVEGTGSLRFDFGVESAAWLEFDSPDLTGSVEMSISEFNQPAKEQTGLLTASPKRYGNTYRLELNSELYEGVRFGWIHVRVFERPWHITAVRAVCQVKPTNYLGSFACSDPMLTRIWYTGAYTVKANFYKNYFGAVLMDRGDRFSWTGDAHPAQAAALVSFGNWNFIKENLESTAKTSNGIESYSLYWILSLVEYYRHTADRAVLEKYLDHTKSLLDHAASIYSDPPISFYGWDERLGAGFEQPDRFETKSAYRMLFIRTILEFASALNEIGHQDASETYRDLAHKKIEQLRSNERWFEPLGVHALADALNTGLLNEYEKQGIFAQAFSNRLNRLSYSPFNQSFIIQAMAIMNRYEEAMVTINDMWGGQIDYGGTTFFEVYAPSWNRCMERNGAVPNCQVGYTSLAHPWGAGVTAWLSREVLGIRPTSPGFKEIEILPHLPGGLTWVSGSVPTPNGLVDFYFDQVSGDGTVTIPPGSKGRLGIPGSGRLIHKVIFNGHDIWDGNFHGIDGVGGARVDGDFLFLEDVQHGSHKFSISFKGHISSSLQERLFYPIGTATRDVGTSGNWSWAYGKDGYVLFDYDGVKKNREEIPSRVMSVRPSTWRNGGCQHAQVTSSTVEQRALEPDRQGGRLRKVGQLYTGDPIPGQETMSVDVEVGENSEFKISLYFLDWDRLGRRQSIAVYDLNTLNRLAPVEVIDNFAEGIYLTYPCMGSVRFRIDQIRGNNAVLNAIFFDPLC